MWGWPSSVQTWDPEPDLNAFRFASNSIVTPDEKNIYTGQDLIYTYQDFSGGRPKTRDISCFSAS